MTAPAPRSGSLWVPALLFSVCAMVLGGPTFFTLLSKADATQESARCAQQEPAIGADEPRRAAALADALWAEPNRSDCLLSQHGMTREEFVALMEAIAADEGASRQYAEARRAH